MVIRYFATTFLVLAATVLHGSDPQDPSSVTQEKGWITSISPAGEGKFVAGSATGLLLRPGAVSQLDPNDLENPVKLYEHPSAVWAVVGTKDGSTVASADYRGNLVTFDVASSKATTHESAFERWCQTLVVGPNDKTLLAGNESGKVFHWSLADAKVAKSIELCEASITSISVSPSGTQIAAADGTGKVHLLKYPELESVGTIAVGEGAAWCVAYAGDSETLVVGSADRNLYRVAAKADAKPISIARGTDWITRIAVSESGEIAASEVSGKIHFASGGSVSTIGAESGVWALCFGAPGQMLVGTRKNGVIAAGQSWTFLPAATTNIKEAENQPTVESETDSDSEKDTEPKTPSVGEKESEKDQPAAKDEKSAEESK